jgi:hypothetical protein
VKPEKREEVKKEVKGKAHGKRESKYAANKDSVKEAEIQRCK